MLFWQRILRHWGAVKRCSEFLATISQFGLIVAVAFWFNDLQGAVFQRTDSAWTTVARATPGESGIGAALTYLSSSIPLVKSPTPLDFVDISSSSDNQQIILSSVDIRENSANFSDFSHTRIVRPVLIEVDFIGSDFSDVTLTDGTIEDVVFAGANLSRSRLLSTSIRRAKLSGADLTFAKL
jgi:uncharacterized protein YjbI with pentapeptide repeats